MTKEEEKKETETRVRFAPSPTGPLHVGGARTALFNWLFAKECGGKFVIRIDDTDRARSTEEDERSILRELKWLEITHDEGPDLGGPYGPYRQSERLSLYTEYSEKLLKEGKAYLCYCSQKRLEKLRKKILSEGKPPVYDGLCSGLKFKPEGGSKPTIRFKVPGAAVNFVDLVRGERNFDASLIGDFIIMGSDGVPSYNFAAATDDALMNITHVIRGEDHISNTPKQILIAEALGLAVPSYGHVSLITGPGGKPLSKRNKSTTVKALRKEGYPKAAVINTLVRLGYAPGDTPAEKLLRIGHAPGDTLIGMDTLAEGFALEKLSSRPATFDVSRLKAFSREKFARTEATEIAPFISTEFPGVEKVWLEEAIDALKAEVSTLKELVRYIKPFASETEGTLETKVLLTLPEANKVATTFAEELESEAELTADNCKAIIKRAGKKTGAKGKKLFLPIRAALTGRLEGIEIEKAASLLGKDKAIERIRRACANICPIETAAEISGE